MKKERIVNKIVAPPYSYLAYLLITILIILMFSKGKLNVAEGNTKQCIPESTVLKLEDNGLESLEGHLKENQHKCIQFHAVSGQKLSLDTNTNVTILTPSNESLTLYGSSQNILSSTGNYSLLVGKPQKHTPYSIKLKLEDKDIAVQPKNKPVEVQAYKPEANTIPLQLSYNVATPPPFQQDQKLQKVVDSIVNFAQLRGLPLERLSISLVDLNSSICCAYASYSDQEPRYPASIVKLFWMVDLYGQYEAGVIPEGAIAEKELQKMIQDSSNESASRVLDQITQTESGKSLPDNKLTEWIAQRNSANHFFEQAGYQNINVAQKTFPIPYLKLTEPKGRDRQLRGNQTKPLRNYLTTHNVARLLFEINNEQSITKSYSQKMKSLLKRDLNPLAWKQKPYNSISGFLGESLPVNTNFSSKMGWTFSNRNDAAIISSHDGRISYILVIFGDDPSFYKNKNFLPEVSRMVYNQMANPKTFQ